DVTPDEIQVVARARHGRAAKPGERIHHGVDSRQTMKPEALIRQPRREGGRMGPIAIAPLNRFVRDEPRVATAPNAVRRAVPARDVRRILVRDAKRQTIELRGAARREVEHELVAVVEEPIAVDWLVVADGEVAVEARVPPGELAFDRNRLDP